MIEIGINDNINIFLTLDFFMKILNNQEIPIPKKIMDVFLVIPE
jgi:hypothetical protein